MSDLFGKAGTQLLDHLQLSTAFAARVNSAAAAAGAAGRRARPVWRHVAARLAHHRGYRAIQAIDGLGPVLAAVLVAEIGDVNRFPGPAQLASWVGLTPRHRESDTHVHRGKITKQGSRLARWAAVEAVQLPARNRPQTGRRRDRVSMPSWPPASAMAARRGRERGFSLDRSEQAS